MNLEQNGFNFTNLLVFFIWKVFSYRFWPLMKTFYTVHCRDFTSEPTINEEDEPMEIRAPNKKESMEWGTLPVGMSSVEGSAGDFYEDSTKMYTVATNKTIKNMMKVLFCI